MWWWLIPRRRELLGRLMVSSWLLVGGCRDRFLMRVPYRTLDRRRLGMRVVGMLLALSASCVLPLRRYASLPRTHIWLFSLMSASCLGLRPPAAMTVGWFPSVQAASSADQLKKHYVFRRMSHIYACFLTDMYLCLILHVHLRIDRLIRMTTQVYLCIHLFVWKLASTDFKRFRTMQPASSWKLLRQITLHLIFAPWTGFQSMLESNTNFVLFVLVLSLLLVLSIFPVYSRFTQPLDNSDLLQTSVCCSFHLSSHTVNALSLTPLQRSGTHFRKTSDFLCQFLPVDQHSKPTFFQHKDIVFIDWVCVCVCVFVCVFSEQVTRN